MQSKHDFILVSFNGDNCDISFSSIDDSNHVQDLVIRKRNLLLKIYKKSNLR
jgi:hypothetical protein